MRSLLCLKEGLDVRNGGRELGWGRIILIKKDEVGPDPGRDKEQQPFWTTGPKPPELSNMKNSVSTMVFQYNSRRGELTKDRGG